MKPIQKVFIGVLITVLVIGFFALIGELIFNPEVIAEASYPNFK